MLEKRTIILRLVILKLKIIFKRIRRAVALGRLRALIRYFSSLSKSPRETPPLILSFKENLTRCRGRCKPSGLLRPRRTGSLSKANTRNLMGRRARRWHSSFQKVARSDYIRLSKSSRFRIQAIAVLLFNQHPQKRRVVRPPPLRNHAPTTAQWLGTYRLQYAMIIFQPTSLELSASWDTCSNQVTRMPLAQTSILKKRFKNYKSRTCAKGKKLTAPS